MTALAVNLPLHDAAARTARPRLDAAAFAELADRHERAALAVADAVLGRDPQASADAVQEAAVRAWAGRDSLAEIDRFGGWYLQIVRNCAADVVRRESRRRERHRRWRSWWPFARDAEPADVEAERDERRCGVLAALADLDEPTRIAVAMRYYDGRPSRDIAAALGCSPAAVDMRLKRARETLRDRLAPFAPDGEAT